MMMIMMITQVDKHSENGSRNIKYIDTSCVFLCLSFFLSTTIVSKHIQLCTNVEERDKKAKERVTKRGRGKITCPVVR